MSSATERISLVRDIHRAEMAVSTAILITCGVITPGLLMLFQNPAAGKLLLAITILCSSGWVAMDSAWLKVREYKSPMAAYPFVLFTACLGLWLVMFPAYLVIRSKIQAGSIARGSNPRERYLLHSCIGLWCLVVAIIAATYFMALTLSQGGMTGLN